MRDRAQSNDSRLFNAGVTLLGVLCMAMVMGIVAMVILLVQ